MDLHQSLTTTPSMLSSQLDVLEQCASSANDGCLQHSILRHAPINQNSMRSTLQSCLELLDRHCDRLNSAYEESLDMRTHIAEILAGCQSKVAIGNVGSWDSGVDLQGIIPNKLQTAAPVALDGLDAFPWLSIPLDLPLLSPEPLAFYTQLLDQEDSPLWQEYVEVASTLPEMADPSVDQFFLDSLLSATPNSVNGGLDAQPFHKFIPQDGTCSEGETLSGPSAGRHQQLCFPVMQDGEGKVKCTWSGCWSVVKKDNYARHVNEIHLRQFRAVCASCGKAFQRPYMKKKHNCPSRHSKRRISQTMKLPKGV